MNARWLVSFLLCGVISWSSHAETVVLTPVADTTLHQKFPDHNIGGHFDVSAGGVGSGERTRALIRFELTGKIPSSATITSATLTVHVTRQPSSGGANSTFELRRVMRSWNEGNKASSSGEDATTGETTWNNRVFPDMNWSAPGGDLGTDFASEVSASAEISGRASYTFASTPSLITDAQSWIQDPEKNFGWVLMSRAETTPETARRFASREDPANGPTLTLEYAQGSSELRITSFSIEGDTARASWQSGTPPYQLQKRAALIEGAWENVGSPTSETTIQFPLAGTTGFFRLSQVAGDMPKTAQYEVVFKSDWSPVTHPDNFPLGAHWSPLIGGTHNANVSFWMEGVQATQGIEDVAELGNVVALRNEVNAAIASGYAKGVLSRPGSSPPNGTASINFTVDRDFPLVTLITMIAPSPDWFTGVHGLSLIENGQWVDQKTVVLDLYDAGTDSGITYNSLDADTQPRELIRKITGFPALVNGVLVPFGTFMFTRK